MASITRTPDRRFLFRQLLPQVKEILSGPDAVEGNLLALCQVLHSGVNWYDWVGFYLVDPDTPQILVLGSYVGDSTDHTRVPFGKGICGQAAERRETFLVDNVSQEPNYLACSLKVKSEIVVPILKEGSLVGVLDIDSHSMEAFNAVDQNFLEGICELVSAIL